MAKAVLALRISEQSMQWNGTEWVCDVSVVVNFWDDEETPPINYQEIVNSQFPVASTPQQIKTAMTDSLIARAAYNFPSWTVAANDIILPDLQRG